MSKKSPDAREQVLIPNPPRTNSWRTLHILFSFLGLKILDFRGFRGFVEFCFFDVFLRVRTGPNSFPDLLASFLVEQILKMVD